ncbi:hypothetical protein A2U01_0051834, partial [Trifolium medium]|nr:hypothetical protein [Trifolium medium]
TGNLPAAKAAAKLLRAETIAKGSHVSTYRLLKPSKTRPEFIGGHSRRKKHTLAGPWKLVQDLLAAQTVGKWSVTLVTA